MIQRIVKKKEEHYKKKTAEEQRQLEESKRLENARLLEMDRIESSQSALTFSSGVSMQERDVHMQEQRLKAAVMLRR